jgi:soluble lytic murein transglycosylase-like protein
LKERVVSRIQCRNNSCFAALSVLLASAPAAHADVLEINGSDAQWVAGGTRSVAPSPKPVEPGRASDAPVTSVASTSGPHEWQAHVSHLAAKYDISPRLLEAVVWQESRWRHTATSPAGAYGLAQLMPGTARDLGVDRTDPRQNLEGGARYLRMQLDAFGGDLEKALAAYNAGPGRVEKAGGIPRIRETQQYVAAIIGRLSAPIRR